MKFKIYKYVNGLGDTVFKAKQQEFIGYGWLRDTFDGSPTEWRTLEIMCSHLHDLAERKRRMADSKMKDKKRNQLTLIIMKEVEL